MVFADAGAISGVAGGGDSPKVPNWDLSGGSQSRAQDISHRRSLAPHLRCAAGAGVRGRGVWGHGDKGGGESTSPPPCPLRSESVCDRGPPDHQSLGMPNTHLHATTVSPPMVPLKGDSGGTIPQRSKPVRPKSLAMPRDDIEGSADEVERGLPAKELFGAARVAK